MNIPYRTRQQLLRAAKILLVLLVVAAIAWGLWFIWLQRFVVYTRESGAVLDFALETMPLNGQEALPPENDLAVEIHYNEGDDRVNMNVEMGQMNGYYVDAETLVQNPAAVWDKIKTLPDGTAVMVDMKSIYGSFYYTTSTGMPQSDSVDKNAVDELVANLRKSDYYVIARVPALRDREFALKNTRNGLPAPGGYLWMDEEGCYWLNPTTQETQLHLINIATELRDKGFNEVVFDYFSFPPTDDILFGQDRMEALAQTAQVLVDNCATGYFAVSFVNNGGAWTAPVGRTRVYMNNAGDPTALDDIAKTLNLPDPKISLVFQTGNPDTRYENYSVLRPISMF